MQATISKPSRLSNGEALPPREELDFAGLLLIGCGHTAFQLLWAAVELDVFTILATRGPLTRVQLAEALNLQAQPARVLLQGLTALRLLRQSGGRYTNATISERHLVRGKPGCLIPLLGWQHHIVYKGLSDFAESLKQNRNVGLRHFPGQGSTLYERLVSHPEIEQVFQAAMSGLSSQANVALAEAADLHDTHCLLDVGGGDGTNAINLARRFPNLRAIVFDSPTVCALADRHIAQAGLAERITTVPGNCFVDAFPAGVDAFLLAHILTIWSPAKNLALLKKCHAALPPGGKVLVFNMVSWDDDSGPLICALGSPYFQAIATGEGMLYSRRDYETWLQEAGFASTTFTNLPMEHGLFVATK